MKGERGTPTHSFCKEAAPIDRRSGSQGRSVPSLQTMRFRQETNDARAKCVNLHSWHFTLYVMMYIGIYGHQIKIPLATFLLCIQGRSALSAHTLRCTPHDRQRSLCGVPMRCQSQKLLGEPKGRQEDFQQQRKANGKRIAMASNEATPHSPSINKVNAYFRARITVPTIANNATIYSPDIQVQFY